MGPKMAKTRPGAENLRRILVVPQSGNPRPALSALRSFPCVPWPPLRLSTLVFNLPQTTTVWPVYCNGDSLHAAGHVHSLDAAVRIQPLQTAVRLQSVSNDDRMTTLFTLMTVSTLSLVLLSVTNPSLLLSIVLV